MQSRISAISIDERKDRPPKFFGDLHHPHRLAISLRIRHTEISIDVLLRVARLLLPNQDDFFAVKPRHSAHDRRIIPKSAVAMNLAPISKNALHIIKGVRPLRMPRQIRALPRIQVQRYLAPKNFQPIVQLLNLAARLTALSFKRLQARDLLLDLVQLLLRSQSSVHSDDVPIPFSLVRFHDREKKFRASNGGMRRVRLRPTCPLYFGATHLSNRRITEIKNQ